MKSSGVEGVAAQGSSLLPSQGFLSLLWRGCLVFFRTRARPVLGASWGARWPGSQRTTRQAGNNGELLSNLLEVHGPGLWHIQRASLSPGQRQYWHELGEKQNKKLCMGLL